MKKLDIKYIVAFIWLFSLSIILVASAFIQEPDFLKQFHHSSRGCEDISRSFNKIRQYERYGPTIYSPSRMINVSQYSAGTQAVRDIQKCRISCPLYFSPAFSLLTCLGLVLPVLGFIVALYAKIYIVSREHRIRAFEYQKSTSRSKLSNAQSITTHDGIRSNFYQKKRDSRQNFDLDNGLYIDLYDRRKSSGPVINRASSICSRPSFDKLINNSRPTLRSHMTVPYISTRNIIDDSLQSLNTTKNSQSADVNRIIRHSLSSPQSPTYDRESRDISDLNILQGFSKRDPLIPRTTTRMYKNCRMNPSGGNRYGTSNPGHPNPNWNNSRSGRRRSTINCTSATKNYNYRRPVGPQREDSKAGFSGSFMNLADIRRKLNYFSATKLTNLPGLGGLVNQENKQDFITFYSKPSLTLGILVGSILTH